MSRKRRIARLGLVLVTASTLTACSLTNPHVSWPRVDKGKDVTLDLAIEYSNDAKDAYKSAVGDQAILTNVLATGLIPLGAATLGAAIAGVNAEPLAYLALSGAAIYSVGTWLSSAPRQSVYIAGINGITCAVEAVLALKFDQISLDEGLAALNKQAGLAEGYAREVTRLISEVMREVRKETSQTRSAAEGVSSARRVMEAAQSDYGDGVSLSHLKQRAGQLLVAKVDDIDALVAKQINSTQPDLQTLPNLIQSLGQTARTLTPLPAGAAQLLGAAAPAPTGTGPKPQARINEARGDETSRLRVAEDELSKSLTAMNLAVGMLSAARTKVRAIVNSVTRSKPSDTLKACGVEEVETGFTVRPSGDVTLPRGKTLQISISGGKSPYKAHITPQPAVGVSVLQPIGGGSTVVLSATDKAPPAEYQLLIEDAALNQQSIKIMVAPTEMGAARDVPSGPSDLAVLEAFVAKVKPDNQFALEGGTFWVALAKVDGAGGIVEVTLGADGGHTKVVDEQALKDKIKTLNQAAPLQRDQINILNYDQIKAPGSAIGTLTRTTLPARICPRGAVVDTLGSDGVKKVQRALCLRETADSNRNQVDGLWGCKTSDALKVYQKSLGIAEDGLLSIDLKEKLQALTSGEIAARCTPNAGTDGGSGTSSPPPVSGAVAPAVAADVLSGFAGRLIGNSISVGAATVAIDGAARLAGSHLVSVSVRLMPAGVQVGDDEIKRKLLELREGNESSITADNLKIAR